MSENFRGAVLMMICMGAFVLNDAFVRLAGDSLPLAQILFYRGLLTTITLALVAFYTGDLKLKVSSQDKWLILFRSVTEALAAYFFLTAVMNMPFANVTAILQILPMTVTLAAAVIFKEKVRAFHILLILLGFLGVILIINPAKDGFTIYAGYALISVLLITIRDLLSRKLSVDVPTLIPTVSASLGVLLFSILLITKTAFQPLDLQNSFFIVAAAFFIIFGYYTAVLVMRSGEISFISPFRYTAVLFALMLGFVFFDEQPDGIAFLGMTIVIISGIALMTRNKSVQ
tara:strand:- start:8362 stop:9222 length:861 start_codon:yes stop_codon:yes gene_type:complete